jgi:hypothetical protein
MKQTFNALGYALTPPALVANVSEWLGGLTINQTFTIIISSFVVIFWVFKARKEYFQSQIEKRKMEMMD